MLDYYDVSIPRPKLQENKYSVVSIQAILPITDTVSIDYLIMTD